MFRISLKSRKALHFGYSLFLTCIPMLNRRIFKQERNTEIADNIQAEVKLMLFCTNLDPTTTSLGALAIISYTIQNESGTNTDKIDNKIFITHQNDTMTTF